VFQTGGISLDFKLVTGTLSGVFIQRAFLHVDDALNYVRASSLVRVCGLARVTDTFTWEKSQRKESDV